MTADAQGSEPRTLKRLLWLAGLVFAASFLAFVARGAEGPADPFLAAGPAASRVPGFDATLLRVTAADGAQHELCVLLADDDAARAEGWRGKTELPGYSGIVFAHDETVSSSFTMSGVAVPLSIAFFDGTGLFSGALGMDPCPDGVGCPTYMPPAPFRHALEVPEGLLPSIGVGPGATVAVGGPCPATAPPR